MVSIINTINEDLGSFSLSMTYVAIGSGIQGEEEKTCIVVFETKQEKYKELRGSEIHRLAEKTLMKDLDPLFEGPYKVEVSSLGLLPDKTNRAYEIFIRAIAYTPKHKIIFSESLATLTNTTWTEELDRLTEEVYNGLAADMSLLDGVSKEDMLYSFGVDFTAFNILRVVD